MPLCLVSIGSNLGDRAATLDRAVAKLREHPAVRMTAQSAWRETSPVGGPPGQDFFLNGALLLETSLAPHLFPDNFNRRNSPRVVLGIPIQYRFGNTIAAALTLNLSHGGIAIRTTSPLESAATIKVRFRIPGLKRDIDAEGRVAWSDRRVGMGIQFDKVDPASQTIIDSFVDAHFFSNRKA